MHKFFHERTPIQKESTQVLKFSYFSGEDRQGVVAEVQMNKSFEIPNQGRQGF